MSKAMKIVLGIVIGIVTLILLFFAIYYLWPWNKKFFDKSTVEFEIPGLDSKFTPQGMTTIDGTDDFLISGYMSDNSPSRFYLISDGKVEKCFTLTQSGEDYAGHSGGIVSKGSSIWVVGDGHCYRFSLSSIRNCKDGDKVEIIDSFETSNGADFVFENDGMLWVGEFYRKGNYETESSHRLTTRTDELNEAVVFGYRIDESRKYGLNNSSLIPDKVLSIRGLAQGIAVANDQIVVSTSYGLNDSNIYVYKNVLKENRHGVFTFKDNEIDMWYLDGESIVKTINAPSMSEEIVYKNNRIYVLFESACKKYKIFNRKALTNVYSFDIGEF